VADQGPGFDTQNPPESGHLGLAFLRERVQLLAGTIEVKSSPGHGTLIRVRLPLQPQATADA
jgi:signal transduction histidine kinase